MISTALRSTFVLLALGTVVDSAPQDAAITIAASTPTVSIASGLVVGTTSTVSTPNVATAAVTQYLGIPYAESPPQRFAPAEPPREWSSPLLAQSRKPVCVQEFPGSLNKDHRLEDIYNDPGSPPPPESEDCMYLNVFVPPGAKPGDQKAVLFWIFGGNLQFGGGSLNLYDGSSFAYFQDVIVVTHNYRTNIFGFPGSPQTPLAENNLGYLDQRMALQWTRDNIKAFGGDPQKVTIFGQSAGGLSVRNLLALPPQPVPFHSVIMESEASINTAFAAPIGNGSVFSSSWAQTAYALGCGDSQNQLECMRSKDATAIKQYIESNSLDFFPLDDGKTFVADARPMLNSGSAAKVPIIVGTNRDEGRFVPYTSGLTFETTNLTTVLTTIFSHNPKLVQSVAGLLGPRPTDEAIATALTHALFLCPASQLAQFAHEQGYPVYRYYYVGDFPNLRAFPDAGAFHAVEIPEVFGTYFLSNDLGQATAAQIALSKKMQSAWAAFAKNPSSGPGQGWPELGNGRVWEWGGSENGDGKEISAASIQPLDCAVFDLVLGQVPVR